METLASRIALVTVVTFVACRAQTAPAPEPSVGVTRLEPMRAIQRDIPLTNTIRRAFAAGTRDSTGRPGRNYWQQWMEYTINARLDAATSTITGHETVVLHNNSDSALRRVVLRLDQNYFAPRAGRIEPMPSTIEVTSGMKVSRIDVDGQPATASGLDETVASIDLRNPIAPKGGRATLAIDWSFEVPAVQSGRGQRMGRQGDTLYQVAQWYPRVAMYDDLRGWDYEPYLGNGEFYNNFGKWDVTLDVPAGWIVGATGVLSNPREVLSPFTVDKLARVLGSDTVRTIVGRGENGAMQASAAQPRLTWHFTADTANDFAWATAKNFVWTATRAMIPGRGPVPVNVLYLPGDSMNYAPVPRLARHALEFYSRLWMPYAFPQLTVADGPELGMEYPMFIMSAAGAADHETGHEWWPMTVSNNETWYGWMDEGFNQYMNILSAADLGGRVADLNGLGQSYGQVSGNELESPMMWPANYQGEFYGFTTYGKTPQMLSMLGAIVGDSAVQRAMSQWAHAWRFKHPSPWDYAFFMSNALGRDLGWFWYYWLFTTESVDQSIEGVAQTTDGRTAINVRQDGGMPAPIVLRIEPAPGTTGSVPANARMLDANTALVTYPVDVWFSGQRTYQANLDFGRTIRRITLDPDRRFPDRNPRDNIWPR